MRRDELPPQLIPHDARLPHAAHTVATTNTNALSICTHRRAKVGRHYISTGCLIGARWASTYTLAADGSRLVPVTQ
jgi:hypothetical protein